MVAGKGTSDMNRFITVPAKQGSVLDAEDESCFLLADVTAREAVGEALEAKPLMLAGELVGCVDLDVAARAKSGLVGAAYHRRRCLLAHIALDLHLSLFCLLPPPPAQASSCPSSKDQQNGRR